jgi:hypothetical protein
MSTFQDLSLNYTIVSGTTASLTGHDATLGPNVTIPLIALNGATPYTVIDISNSAFLNFNTMTSVTFDLPSNVTSIGEYAFSKVAPGLSPVITEITIPNSVTAIYSSAFADCINLTTVTFESGTNLQVLDFLAFNKCTSLTAITLPEEGLTYLDATFLQCTSLASVTLPNSLITIGYHTFTICSDLTSINIPSNVTQIGGEAFNNCTSLASVTFSSPSSLKTIGGGVITNLDAFRNCFALTTFTIPASTTLIYTNSFIGCTNLASVYFDASGATRLPNMQASSFDGGTAYYYRNVLASNGSAATNATFTAAGFASSQEINSTDPITCFKEDTKILTNKGYIPIQNLRKGHLVKTLEHYYLPIVMIGKKEIHHPAKTERIQDQLYKCTQSEYPEIFEDLVLTGCHSILVDEFANEEQKEKTIEVNKIIYVTDRKYRLPACADHRASVYEHPGDYTIYHLALEHNDYYMNYGIYANGLLVESCSKRYLKEVANMTLID